MPVPHNENPPESPDSVKLMNGYIEQLDRFGPTIVKATEDYRHCCLSAIKLARQTVLDSVERSGRKPPFINTLADAATGVVSTVLVVQCTAVSALVKAHRKAATSIRDAMTGKVTD
jgi:hypothetical protein